MSVRLLSSLACLMMSGLTACAAPSLRSQPSVPPQDLQQLRDFKACEGADSWNLFIECMEKKGYGPERPIKRSAYRYASR